MTFAVQPSSWLDFDEHGCEWAKDLDDALRIAMAWKESEDEDFTVWRVGTDQAVRWVRTDFLTGSL